MPIPTPEQLKAIVIDWLGAAYDEDGRYGEGNPDYRDERDVLDLVARIMQAIHEVK